MVSNGKDLGHLSLGIRPGDEIAIGDEVKLVFVEKKRGTLRIRIIAPKSVLVNYVPRRLLRGPQF